MDYIDRLIDLAFDEDLGAAGDVTTAALVSSDVHGRGLLLVKEDLVLSGIDTFARVFHRLDREVVVDCRAQDGDFVKDRTVVAEVTGRLASLLIAERTALNIIQRACGVATMARKAQDSVAGTKLKVLDTRKTAPGMRSISKQAVKDGGAHNHRFGLFDGVLIKDNHIAAVGGSVKTALRLARANAPRLVKIEIEVTTLQQLDDVLEEGSADVVMLDNMSDDQIAEAVRRCAGRVEIEVSGGITLERLPKLAKLGADYVSMGALTHSARSMDLSFEIELAPPVVRP